MHLLVDGTSSFCRPRSPCTAIYLEKEIFTMLISQELMYHAVFSMVGLWATTPIHWIMNIISIRVCLYRAHFPGNGVLTRRRKTLCLVLQRNPGRSAYEEPMSPIDFLIYPEEGTRVLCTNRPFRQGNDAKSSFIGYYLLGGVCAREDSSKRGENCSDFLDLLHHTFFYRVKKKKKDVN